MYITFVYASFALAFSALIDKAGGITVEPDISDQVVKDAIVGSNGVIINSLTRTGGSACVGVFEQGSAVDPQNPAAFPDEGLVMSTGNVLDIVGPNNLGDTTGFTSGTGDSDLDALIPGYQTYDACIVDIDFQCPDDLQGSDIKFNYVFGSEEYNEYVGNIFNDVFGWFLNGVNIALLPDQVTPVAINNVNNLNNSQYYNDNTGTPAPFDIEADGFTTKLVAQGPTLKGSNKIKLAIGDAGDSVLDSWVLIEAGSFRCECADDSPECGGVDGGGGGGRACFSGETTVTVQGKGKVYMKDVQMNDLVHTGTREDGSAIFQPVYSFGHLERNTSPTEYIQIFHSETSKLNDDRPIEISAEHLIYLADTRDPVRADTVMEGDILLHMLPDGNGSKRVTVTKIKKKMRNDAYLPLTPAGTIVVNGVVASTYVSIQKNAPKIMEQFGISQQTLFHLWLSPYRMVCMGLSPKLCQNDYNRDTGVIHWLEFGQSFAEFGESFHPIIQWIGVGIVYALLCMAMAIETVLGYSGVGTMILFYFTMALTAFFIHFRSHKSCTKPNKGATKTVKMN